VSVQNLSEYGGYQAVIPRVEGTAYVTGQHNFYLDPADPFKHGFIFRSGAQAINRADKSAQNKQYMGMKYENN
jgi:hypothetical protein